MDKTVAEKDAVFTVNQSLPTVNWSGVSWGKKSYTKVSLAKVKG